MCGRFSLTQPKEAVEAMFGPLGLHAFPPRYNIAPTQPILIVASAALHGGAGAASATGRQAILARWGLWPSWMKDLRDFPLLFNARSETACEKPAFRAAMRYRRVLVPASGFYEWQRLAAPAPRKTQPYWLPPTDGGLVAFGGVMETWHAADGSEVDTAAILTTEAPAAFRTIHDRMPLVIEPGDFDRWLDCRSGQVDSVRDLLRPAPDDRFKPVQVSDRVNKAAHEGPALQTKEVAAPPAEAAEAPKPNASGGDRQMRLL